jgi:hypothetical protein
MKPLEQPRAVAYARYSSEQQRDASIDDQLRNCRRRAETESWLIIREYADRAITGADSSRPQYREMLSAADRDELDILIVDDLSRLARDQVESERVIRRLEFQGIRLVATADGYDSQTKTATRKIQRTVKGLVNEMRLDELREQVHRDSLAKPSKAFGAAVACTGTHCALFSTRVAATPTVIRNASGRSWRSTLSKRPSCARSIVGTWTASHAGPSRKI